MREGRDVAIPTFRGISAKKGTRGGILKAGRLNSIFRMLNLVFRLNAGF